MLFRSSETRAVAAANVKISRLVIFFLSKKIFKNRAVVSSAKAFVTTSALMLPLIKREDGSNVRNAKSQRNRYGTIFKAA